jgi:hypothetical protein
MLSASIDNIDFNDLGAAHFDPPRQDPLYQNNNMTIEFRKNSDRRAIEGNLNTTNANNETLEHLVNQFQGKVQNGDIGAANSLLRSTNRSISSGIAETGTSG